MSPEVPSFSEGDARTGPPEALQAAVPASDPSSECLGVPREEGLLAVIGQAPEPPFVTLVHLSRHGLWHGFCVGHISVAV